MASINKKLASIMSGWENYLTEGDALPEAQTMKRAAICATCPNAKKGKLLTMLKDKKLAEIEGMYCALCNCPLSAKVRSELENCEKWT